MSGSGDCSGSLDRQVGHQAPPRSPGIQGVSGSHPSPRQANYASREHESYKGDASAIWIGHRRPCRRTQRPIQVAGRVGWGCPAKSRRDTLAHGQRARSLRKRMSDGERKLWRALRAKQMEGSASGVSIRLARISWTSCASIGDWSSRLMEDTTQKMPRWHTTAVAITGSRRKDIESCACRTRTCSAIWAVSSIRFGQRCRRRPRCVRKDAPTRRAE